MRIGKQEFDCKNRTYIMGILNVTPDSFSDGGSYQRKDAALFRVGEMIAEGAHIIDIGGESTRPGYTQISEQEEIERVMPIVETIKQHYDIPVSVDTYKSRVASAAIAAGADLINDIWGLKYDKDMAGVASMAEVIAKGDVACCLMHNRKEAVYGEFLKDVKADLAESVQLALLAGISKDKMILDPGVGFAKSYEQNLQIIKQIGSFTESGYPILLGTSRKSVIGLTLDLPVEERLEGTLVTTVMAVLNGCSFVRVHDIKANARAIRMAESIRDISC